MSDDDIFADTNPFKKLAKKGLKNGAPSSKGKVQTPHPVRPTPPIQKKPQINEADDAAFFLDAMRHVTTKAQAKKQGRHVESLEKSLDLAAPQGTPTSATIPQALSQQGKTQSAAEALIPAPLSTHEDSDDMDFMQAMQTVRPLINKGREVPTEPEATQAAPPPVEPTPLDEPMPSDIEFMLASTREYVEGHVVGLDRMILGKLQAGHLRPEAHIDLHGFAAQQAYLSLIQFFKIAYLKNYRTVLVVPGRGLNSPAGIAILREKVQDWLTQDPLKRIILAFCTAKPNDGGAGALYVLLRKHKKSKGKIVWQRTPVDGDFLQSYEHE